MRRSQQNSVSNDETDSVTASGAATLMLHAALLP
jgi:hypothetical protein